MQLPPLDAVKLFKRAGIPTIQDEIYDQHGKRVEAQRPEQDRAGTSLHTARPRQLKHRRAKTLRRGVVALSHSTRPQPASQRGEAPPAEDRPPFDGSDRRRWAHRSSLLQEMPHLGEQPRSE